MIIDTNYKGQRVDMYGGIIDLSYIDYIDGYNITHKLTNIQIIDNVLSADVLFFKDMTNKSYEFIYNNNKSAYDIKLKK